MPACMHSDVHMRAFTCAHVCTCTQKCVHMNVCCAFACMHVFMFTQVCIHSSTIVCMHIHTHMCGDAQSLHAFVHLCACMCVHACLHMHLHMHLNVCACGCVLANAHACLHTCICAFACMHACAHTCAFSHIHTHVLEQFRLVTDGCYVASNECISELVVKLLDDSKPFMPVSHRKQVKQGHIAAMAWRLTCEEQTLGTISWDSPPTIQQSLEQARDTGQWLSHPQHAQWLHSICHKVQG